MELTQARNLGLPISFARPFKLPITRLLMVEKIKEMTARIIKAPIN